MTFEVFDVENPDFVHESKDEGEGHTFKGSLTRHIAVEKAVYLMQKIVEGVGDAFPLFDVLYIPIIIGFGVNCNFPIKDVMKYVVWWLRGMP